MSTFRIRPLTLALAVSHAVTIALLMSACSSSVDTVSAKPKISKEVVAQKSEKILSTSDATLADETPELKPEATEPEAVAEIVAEEPEAGDHTPGARFELRRGETLAHFARWSELSIEQIAEASDLDLGGNYQVGTEIVVPVGPEEMSTLITKRDAHHAARAEAYLSGRGGSVGSAFVVVRSGDTAWSIAKDNSEIPVWLLESYNPAVDLDALQPGQELMVPTIGSGIVADAEEVSIESLSETEEVSEN